MLLKNVANYKCYLIFACLCEPASVSVERASCSAPCREKRAARHSNWLFKLQRGRQQNIQPAGVREKQTADSSSGESGNVTGYMKTSGEVLSLLSKNKTQSKNKP